MSGHPHDRQIAAMLVATVLLGGLVVGALLAVTGGAVAVVDEAAGADTAADATTADAAADATTADAAADATAADAAADATAADAAADATTADGASVATAAAATAEPTAAAAPSRSHASQTGPTLTVSNASVEPDGATTLRLSLSRAPDGLSGFELTVELDGSGVATIADAGYPNRYGHTSAPAIADDGQSVTVEAVDIHDEVTPGDTDVPLATLRVDGRSEGETSASVAAVQVDADGGAEVDPALEAGVVRVARSDSVAQTTAAAAPVGNGGADDRPESGSDDGAGLGLRLAAVGLLALASLLGVFLTRDP